MPRVPEKEVERIRHQTDIVALVRSRGIDLRRHGRREFAGLCPFHRADQPCFTVSPELGLFRCAGCGAAGNAIRFLEMFEGVSHRHAFEILESGPLAFSTRTEGPIGKTTVPRLESPLDAAAGDGDLMLQVVAYYHERLLATPAAIDCLACRGLRHDEALRTFRIGFADRTLGLRLPQKNRRQGAAIRSRLQGLGVLLPSGHERFNGCVVVPVFDAAGRLAQLYGRRTTGHLRPGTPRDVCLPGPHAGVWNAEAMGGRTDGTAGHAAAAILCDAPLDALAFWVNGFRSVTFAPARDGLSDALLECLLARHVGRVYLAYRSSHEASLAAERDAAKLAALGVEVFRVRFPWGQGACEHACRLPAAEAPATALRSLLNAAQWWAPGVCRTAVPVAGLPSSAASDTSATEQPVVSGPDADRSVGPGERLTRSGEYCLLRVGDREYRVSGLDRNSGPETLKVALRLHCGELLYLDTLDMAQDAQRRRFVERAAAETGLDPELVRRDLGRLLLALEQERQDRRGPPASPDPGTSCPSMPEADRDEALAFLRAPGLIDRIGAAFDACGLVGEETNRLAAYLACTSRKLDKPLALIVQSASAAGKSALMDAVLAMFPEEERVRYSAVTGQSLFYLGDTDLRHKVLAIVEEEGAHRASYALKLLQSEGELTIASTGKDPRTGRLESRSYRVEGPVMIFLATTAAEIDEELQNRCLTLAVDDSREQTRRIHEVQRKARTLQGLVAREKRKGLLVVLRNAQRLLKPLAVVNDYAERLTFRCERTRARRDHEKYLTLIDAIALLHQHQRPVEVQDVDGRAVSFVRVAPDDIALANRLAGEILARSLDDLSPQARTLLRHAKALVRECFRTDGVERSLALVTRSDLRQATGWSECQVRVHLRKLEHLECLCRRRGRQGSACAYELLVDPNEPEAKCPIGLIDVALLRGPANGSTTTTPTSCAGEPLRRTSCKAPHEVQSTPSQQVTPEEARLRNFVAPHYRRPSP
jgi:hypothetical protein